MFDEASSSKKGPGDKEGNRNPILSYSNHQLEGKPLSTSGTHPLMTKKGIGPHHLFYKEKDLQQPLSIVYSKY